MTTQASSTAIDAEAVGTVPRLSLNRWTFRTTPVQEFLEATTSRGIEAVGLWRQDVEEVGLDALRRRVDDAGLRVSSLCRGGFITASVEADRAAALADNLLAPPVRGNEAETLMTDLGLGQAFGADRPCACPGGCRFPPFRCGQHCR